MVIASCANSHVSKINGDVTFFELFEYLGLLYDNGSEQSQDHLLE